ncbi:MAG: hypothetical protein JNN00_02045 [Chitinophagaceae bacterium]|nr:hypothetical protein [Chitinophagaceae bacterium]
MENKSNTTSTVLNKIIIPVVTTVLGATAIYFLGFNKKSGRSDMEKMLITKEATIKAWKSFVTTQNIGYKNMKSLSEEYYEKLGEAAKEKGLKGTVPVFTDFKDDLFKEMKKTTNDINEILKNEDIDEGFVSMLNRTLENGKDEEKKVIAFFDDITSLARSDIDEQEKAARWEKLAGKFSDMEERASARAANEAEEIAKTLSERYGQSFDLNQLQVYVDYKKEKDNKPEADKTGGGDEKKEKAPSDPGSETEYTNDGTGGSSSGNPIEPTTSLLTGEWEMKGGALELSKNGNMFWTFEGKGYTSGSWKLQDGKLQMKATNPDNGKTSTIIGTLSDITQNSFTLTVLSTPKEVYHFKRSR